MARLYVFYAHPYVFIYASHALYGASHAFFMRHIIIVRRNTKKTIIHDL